MRSPEILFALFVGAMYVLNWIAKRAQNNPTDERPSAPKTPAATRPAAQTEEERMRRFMEALGRPASATPPPKATPRTRRATVPKRTIQPIPPLVAREFFPGKKPTLPTIPSPAEGEGAEPFADPEPWLAQPTAATPPPALPKVSPALKPLLPTALETTAAAPRAPALNALFDSPEALRRAVIMREVFGPPRSLQALDDLRSF